MSPSIDMCLKIVYEKIVDNFLLIVAVPLTIAAATIAMARLKPNESTDRIQSTDLVNFVVLGYRSDRILHAAPTHGVPRRLCLLPPHI